MGRSGRTKSTPPQIAEDWGVSPEKILGWIHTGELRAINVATKPGGRPRYLVDATDLAAFEMKRQVVVTEPVARRRRKRDPEVIDFF